MLDHILTSANIASKFNKFNVKPLNILGPSDSSNFYFLLRITVSMSFSLLETGGSIAVCLPLIQNSDDLCNQLHFGELQL